MSYTMQGLVGEQHLLATEKIAAGMVSVLRQGKALLPFTERLRNEQGVPFLPLTDEGGELPEKIGQICARISQRGRIAYIEAEFFGGAGIQAAAVWEKGSLIQAPFVEQHAINQALRSLGVQVASGKDEFDTLQLGAHRNIEDWVAVPTSSRR